MSHDDEIWELPSPDQTPPPPETVRWIETKLGTSIASIEPLPGGLSSAIHRLTLTNPTIATSGAERVVLRRHTNSSWMAREPYIPHHEARTLQLLTDLDIGVATPTLIVADPDGDECDVPTIIMTEVAGQPMIDPEDPAAYAERLAACLARIHQTPVPDGLEPFRRWDNRSRPTPVWLTDHDHWHQATELVAGPLPDGEPAFLHRDYHPNNIHWVDGEIEAVVDWLSACVGPVEADLAHCRWNLAVLIEPAIAEHFTAHYRALTDHIADAQTSDDHTSDRQRLADVRLTAYDLSTVLSAPVGPFPTYAWNSLGRPDLTPETVPGRIERWLAHILDNA